MPGTSYDENAMRIASLRSGTRTWRFRLMVWAVFVGAIAVGAVGATAIKTAFGQ